MGERSLPILEEGSWSRRGVLQLLGLGALAACEPPREPILPYTVQPTDVRPGKPLFYATSMTIDGYATGLLVESHVGRPTKIEGNPEHPASLGRTGLQHQASILDLYAPGRAQRPRRKAGSATWAAFQQQYGSDPAEATGSAEGAGLHFVLEPTSSPFTVSLIEAVRRRLPAAAFHFFAPLETGRVEEGARRAFGRVLATQRHFDRAAVVLAVDSDFLEGGPFGIRWAHDFAERRRIRDAQGEMNRLYVVEADLTVTGTVADHRLRARPSELPLVLAAVLVAVRLQLGQPPGLAPERLPHGRWAEVVARDLLRHRGESVVIVGDRQPPEAHVLCHALNELLGNVGETIEYTPPAIHEAGEASHDLGGLLASLDSESVRTLVLLDVDPGGTAYADDRFLERLGPVRQTICTSLYETATSRAADWFIPSLHWLEHWGDARAWDGTLGIRQPLIRPLYDGHGPLHVLGVFAGVPEPDPHALLRQLYREQAGGGFEQGWAEAVQRGVIPGTAFAPVQAALRQEAVREALRSLAAQPPAPAGLEISLRADPKLGDGRFGRNDWLLELPDPVHKVSWDNAALLSPSTAKALGVEEGEVLELRWNDRALQIPALPVRGIAEGTVSIALGWGAWHEGEGRQVGVDAYGLRTRAAPWTLAGASAERVVRDGPAGTREVERVLLASGQPHLEMHGRPILIRESLENFRKEPHFVAPHDEPRPSIYGDPWPDRGPQWGMSIDLTTCTGCATCVIACQAENNIPTVGKIGVARGREMHWLRIDRYFLGTDEETVQLLPQPMLCQHCEQAPCEYVCPVNATVHSPDGLNEMIYNRCIGTRFCSNNCPYKVRRFNFLEYNAYEHETPKMQKNPEVTVRARGVMEKCTYCVQRIRTALIEARIDDRQLRDGEVQTACQSACPTGAIVFGLVSDPESAVSKLHAAPQSYGVLQHELGTAPRTRYLAHLRNVNEELG